MTPNWWVIASLVLTGPAGASKRFGTASKGRLEDGVALPGSVPNFSPCSRLGITQVIFDQLYLPACSPHLAAPGCNSI